MVFIWTDRAPICVQGIWCIPFAFPAYVFTGYPYLDEKPALSSFKELYIIGEIESNFRYI